MRWRCRTSAIGRVTSAATTPISAAISAGGASGWRIPPRSVTRYCAPAGRTRTGRPHYSNSSPARSRASRIAAAPPNSPLPNPPPLAGEGRAGNATKTETDMPPKIGYLLPTRERIMEGRPQTGPLLDLAARAEGLGFDSVWVGDSLLARPQHDPLTLLAAVAARTKKVQLGTAVFLPALRNPVVLAHQLATLDQISEGRLVLGAGIASDVANIRAEFVAAGVPFEGRVGRMMEGLRLARALWTGKPVDWDGRWRVESGVLGPKI